MGISGIDGNSGYDAYSGYGNSNGTDSTSGTDSSDSTSGSDQQQQLMELFKELIAMLEGQSSTDDDSDSPSDNQSYSPQENERSEGGGGEARGGGQSSGAGQQGGQWGASEDKAYNPQQSGSQSTEASQSTSPASSTSDATSSTSGTSQASSASDGQTVQTGTGTGFDYTVKNNTGQNEDFTYSDQEGHSKTVEIDNGQSATFVGGGNDTGIRIEESNAQGQSLASNGLAEFSTLPNGGKMSVNSDVSDVAGNMGETTSGQATGAQSITIDNNEGMVVGNSDPNSMYGYNDPHADTDSDAMIGAGNFSTNNTITFGAAVSGETAEGADTVASSNTPP